MAERNPEEDQSKFNYNKSEDIERRKHLDLLFQRPLETIEEERFLIDKMKSIKRNFPKLNENRQKILRLLIGDFFAATEGISSTIAHKTLKRKKRKSIKGQSEFETERKDSKGTFLLSQKTGFTRVVTNKNLDKLLSEVEIGSRPTLACLEVCNKFNEFKTSCYKLLELKKSYEKLKIDSRHHKLQKMQQVASTPDRNPKAASTASVPNLKRKASGDNTTPVFPFITFRLSECILHFHVKDSLFNKKVIFKVCD